MRKLTIADTFIPDWSERYTKEQAEEQFGYIEAHDPRRGEVTPFQFKGPGWYIAIDKDGKPDTLLVVPEEIPEGDSDVHKFWKDKLVTEPFIQEWPPGTVFRFYVFNGRNPCHLFGLIAQAPTRLDQR